ncbi:Neurotrophin receptor-interacting factor 1 [Frankliniella fusca]|uniref:Neurotrophin receptor-interacting factor 1 n=1 Tax=Frankliniella fusca TaxID=407009 RepID=A0AAE1LCN3_9NEOP|nr:Neurotrophin receptor-interacting factor 1 [Frankliniella fusca]
MQPVVVLLRDPAVDAMAISRRSRSRRSREHRDSWREHRHSGPRKRSRSERDRERGRERERSHPLQILAEVVEAEGLEEDGESRPVKRRKKWSSLSHDLDPSYRNRHRAEEGLGSEVASSDHLHVMELVKRWRQAEPQATPSGEETPMPHSPPGLGLDLAPLASEERLSSPGPSLGPLAPPTALPPEEPQLAAASSLYRCEACGEYLNDADEKATHVKLHPYHCQRCYQAFASQVSRVALQTNSSKP